MLMRTFPPAAQHTTRELRRPLFSGTSSRWQLGKCYMPLDIFNQVTDKIPPGPFFSAPPLSLFTYVYPVSFFFLPVSCLRSLSPVFQTLYYPLYLSLFTCVSLRQMCLVEQHSV